MYKTHDGRELPNKKELVKYMIEFHNSPFLEGDAALVKLSQEYVAKLKETDPAKYTVLVGKYAEAGIEVN